ncbi:MAG: hypothetical protein AVO33_10265 [delta proteobacterium ML8_F1]|nr:MAG: hypothetical protein AVO33_10265 [delta proteobacterium ML8_F1]
MKKKWIGWLLAVLAVGVLGGVLFLGEEPDDKPLPPVKTASGYELEATFEDRGGIDTGTAFSLKHPEDVDVSRLEEMILFTPEIDFEIERVSTSEALIRPAALLLEDQIYQVRLKDDSSHSWAFQTKKKLKVLATIPGEGGQYVSTDSGVEIQFNFKDLENFEESLEIEPEVAGSFSSNGYSQIFIPEELQPRTTYRVSLDSNLKVSGSDITLGDDYSFTFTTAAGEGDFGLALKDVFFNYTTSQNHFVPAYMTDGAMEETYDLEVYRFRDHGDFLRDLIAFDGGASLSRLYEEIPSGLSPVYQVETRPERVDLNYDRFSVFEMPETLEEGHYLVKIALGDRQWYSFIQISDLLVYAASFEENNLFWVADAAGQEPVAEAKVEIVGGSRGKTDEEGISILPGTGSSEEETILYGTVTRGEASPFVIRNYKDARERYYFGDENAGLEATDHFKYLYTDRSTYLPTDEVSIFGYLKPREGPQGTYSIRLVSTDYGTKVLDEAALPLTIHGTFTHGFAFEDLSPGTYRLEVLKGEQVILSHGISVNPYTKPLYRLAGEFTKDYFKRGEPVAFRFEAQFFDGTPAKSMTFNYSSYADTNHTGEIQTDDNGSGTIGFTPEYTTENWRPQAIAFDLYNSGAEDRRISLHDSYTFFPKDTMIQLFQEESRGVRIEVNELLAENYHKGSEFTLDALKGEALDTPLEIEVTEHYFEKVEKGSTYDYINKVNRPRFEYHKRERVVETLQVETSEGVYFYETPYLEESKSSYEIKVTLEEEEGPLVETAYLHDGGGHYWKNPDYHYYILEVEDSDQGFSLGQTLDYRLTDQGEALEFSDEKFLLMTLKEGLVTYSILEEPQGSMTFDQSHIPNIHLKGVLLKDGMMTRTPDAALVKFNPSEREAQITVIPGQESYPPGGVVELRVLTRGSDGNPLAADVNLSVVDEAYFELFHQEVDFLKELYLPVMGTGILREFVSTDLSGANFDFFGMAEGGGPEGAEAFRKDFKDTALFMTLTTDEEGEGFVRFTLPDNLTSWRVTYQAVNGNLEASSGKLNLSVSLPFYVVPLISEVYLTGDEPSISLRAFGEAVDGGSPVDYTVTLGTKTLEARGLAKDYTQIPLGSLEKGVYPLKISARQGEYRDGVEKTIEVKDSVVTFNHTKTYDLDKETVFTGIQSVGRITFRNQNESPFIEILMDISRGYGQRVDQRLSSLAAMRLIREHLDEDLKIEEGEFKAYQDPSGGIRLLPYSGTDPLLSARIALMGAEDFDQELLKHYFYSLLYSPEGSRLEVVSALTGLGALREPVLIEIQSLLEEDLTLKEELLLSLALATLGDRGSAVKIYENLETAASDDLEEGEAFVVKGLLMNLALAAGDEVYGDSLFEAVYQEPSDFELVHLERISYLEQRDFMNSSEVEDLRGRVTLSLGDTEETLAFFGYESRSLSVTPGELAALEFTEIEGAVSAEVYALVGAEALGEQAARDFTLTRDYEVSGIPATTFEVGDVVKVTLTPEFTGPKGHLYEITDFIPAGFRLKRLGSNAGWYEEEGQKMIFHYWHQDKVEPIIYYLQAVLPGSYTADHGVMVRTSKPGVSATPQEKLVIQ